ncbi:hypothetical protein K438DRAFT_1962003 [Mycena galopus ATCC 62051]|nr:hypothetical protein K438DRAFT_1962003 [Mycena galopus ATCC 62051]
MHPILRLSALSALPFSARRTALAAAGGSSEHLHEIEYLVQDNLSNPKMLVYLPVFYTNLDPANIPNGDELDGATSSSTRQLILRALVSLKSPWLYFFETYRGLFDDYDITCLDFLMFVSIFKASKEAMSLMFSTNCFRFMLARAWGLLIENEDLFLDVEYPETTTNAGLNAPAQTLTFLLEKVLPQCLMHYQGVECIAQGVKDTEGLVDPETLWSSSRFTAWNHFTTLASERLEIYHRAQHPERLKACHNVDCGRIGYRAEFKRCSGCLNLHYCTIECQKVDWIDGNHRTYCRPGPSIRLSECQEFPGQQRHFLLKLLQHDLLEGGMYRTAANEESTFIAHSPGVPFFMLFDYTVGWCVDIRVEAADAGVSKYFCGEDLVQWSDHVARAVQSNGRMKLNVMAVPAGTKTRYFAIPHCGETY